MLLHPLFIQDHLEVAKTNYFIRGSRSLIGPERTNELLRNRTYHIKWTDSGLINNFNSIRSEVLSTLFSVSNNPYSIDGVKGCNFSFWKTDFIKVNGYNNDILGWGREDSELAIRLINNGVLKLHLKFKAVCFHLHHAIFSRERDSRNLDMLSDAIRNKRIFSANGFSTRHPSEVFIAA
jgi:hypothetical protein